MVGDVIDVPQFDDPAALSWWRSFPPRALNSTSLVSSEIALQVLARQVEYLLFDAVAVLVSLFSLCSFAAGSGWSPGSGFLASGYEHASEEHHHEGEPDDDPGGSYGEVPCDLDSSLLGPLHGRDSFCRLSYGGGEYGVYSCSTRFVSVGQQGAVVPGRHKVKMSSSRPCGRSVALVHPSHGCNSGSDAMGFLSGRIALCLTPGYRLSSAGSPDGD